MGRILTTVLMLTACTLSGCVDHAPAYQQSVLTVDEGLIGSWQLEMVDEKVEKEESPRIMPIEIAARPEYVTGGRLGKHGESELRTKAKTITVPGYLITATLPKDGEASDVIGSLTYDAVLLKVEGATLIAYQPTRARLPDTTFIDFLPVHRILRLERTGDEVRIFTLKVPIVWVPALKPLDSESDTIRLPAETEMDGITSFLVSGTDRLVKVMALAVKTPDAWTHLATGRRIVKP